MSRYDGRKIFTNQTNLYKKKLDSRGLKKIDHYELAKLKHPDALDVFGLQMLDHVWKLNDRYYKIAHEYYSDSTLWWVVAWFNQKPTEADLNIGDVIQIPYPLEKLVTYLGL